MKQKSSRKKEDEKMKLMKKISAVLLSLCLVVPCFSMVVSAADGRISFTDPSTAVGEYVEVKCVLRSTSGNMGDVEVNLEYDEDYLRFDSGNGIEENGDGALTCSGTAGAAEVSFVAKFQALQEGTTKVEITSSSVVDSNGLITALKKGDTTIKLTVGDGSEYTSVGVTVHVGLQQKATIGTATEEDIKYCSLQMGVSIVLKATGLMDNVAGRYECAWTSTNTAVAKINSDGVVTPVAPGMTVIQLTVTRVASGEKMSTTPIALLVTSKGSSTVVASPTPTRSW